MIGKDSAVGQVGNGECLNILTKHIRDRRYACLETLLNTTLRSLALYKAHSTKAGSAATEPLPARSSLSQGASDIASRRTSFALSNAGISPGRRTDVTRYTSCKLATADCRLKMIFVLPPVIFLLACLCPTSAVVWLGREISALAGVQPAAIENEHACAIASLCATSFVASPPEDSSFGMWTCTASSCGK